MKTSDGSAIPHGSTVYLAGVYIPLNISTGIAVPDRSTTQVTFAAVIPGHYVARVLDAGYSVIAEGTVDVIAGQSASLTLVIYIPQPTATSTMGAVTPTAATTTTIVPSPEPSQTANATGTVNALPNTGSTGEGGSTDGPVFLLFLGALTFFLIGVAAWRGRRPNR